MVGWLISASRRSMDGVSTTTISPLRDIISKASKVAVGLQAYANGFVDGLIIRFSD